MEPLLDPQDRLLEEHLLRAGREVDMSAELRATTIAAVGAAGAGLTLVGVSKAGVFSWLSTKGWPYALGMVGVSSIAGFVVVNRPEAPAPQAPAATLGSPTTSSSPKQEPDKATPAPVQDAAALEAPRIKEQEVEPPLPKVATKKPSRLSEELQYLSRASKALSSGNPQQALKELSAYRSKFSSRRLGLEAEALNIQALSQSGQTALARKQAKSFVARHPSSPLVARIKNYTQ